MVGGVSLLLPARRRLVEKLAAADASRFQKIKNCDDFNRLTVAFRHRQCL
jgi:hypothetical protein